MLVFSQDVMPFRRTFGLVAFVLVAVFVLPIPIAAQTAPDSQPSTGFGASASSMIVYVSDFDLDVVQTRTPPKRSATRNSSTAASSAAQTAPEAPPKASSSSATARSSRATSAPDASTEETPADHANALLNAVSESLIRALHQAGYQAERLPAGAALPKAGLRLRGVFAEADESNRARRLLIGGVPVSPNMILFVGVNNLARPEQPLYALADPPYPDPRHGPVITVTSYAPAARFELSRDPGDEELKKVSAKIAAGLCDLLNTNPLLSAQ